MNNPGPRGNLRKAEEAHRGIASPHEGISAAHQDDAPRVASPKKRRLRLLISALLLAIGIALVFYPLVGNLLYDMTAKKAIDAYDVSIEGKTQAELDALWDEAVEYNRDLGTPDVRDPWSGDKDAPPLDRYWDVLDPDGTGVMGYVEVERAGIMVPVYHGVSDEVLQEGAGHIETTALPVGGEGTHAVITAHTGLPDRMLFTNLPLVRVGDVFVLHVLGRELRYETVSVDVIEPDDTSLLQPVEGEERVTLFTCTPYGVNSQRLLVTGAPTDAEPIADLPPAWFAPLCLSVTVFLILAVIVAAILRHRAKKRVREDCEFIQEIERRSSSLQEEGENIRELEAFRTGNGGLHAGMQTSGAAVESHVADEDMRMVRHRMARDRRMVRIWTVAVIVCAALLALSLWMSVGALMRVGLLPYFDLGYTWFDAHAYRLFGF